MARVALLAALLLASLATPAEGRQAENRRLYVLGQAGKGRGFLGAGVQLDWAFAARLRAAPDLLLGEGGAVAALSVLYGLERSQPQEFSLFGGVGAGVLAADHEVEGAVVLRIGVEVPLTSRRLALRLEARDHVLPSDDDNYFVVAAFRIP